MVCSTPDNDDKKESPSDDSKDDSEKVESEKSPEEEGVDSANDLMKKFLEKLD